MIQHILKLFALTFFGYLLTACAGGEAVETGFLNPDSPAANALRDEQSGDDENLGPNAPGYVGPGGEFSLDQQVDPE